MNSLVSNVLTILAFGSAYAVGFYYLSGNALAASAFSEFYSEFIGESVYIVYEQFRPNITKNYEFGIKILKLLMGWFAVLFLLEMMLSLLLSFISLVYGTLRKTIFGSSTINTN